MSEPRRVYLHLGLQKTGTSYLQGVLLHNAGVLAEQGLDLVPASRRDAFELMLQVRERYNAERDPASAATALDRFAEELRRAPGDRALLSQESLAAALPRQVRRLLAACGDREVHVVLTVRDLARQLPSSWQQELKAGKSEPYADYLERLRDAHRDGLTRHPWIQLDPPTVLRRWSARVPPERVHVVTVPPPGQPTTLLLERFCAVLGVDPAAMVPQQRASNTSLGLAQAEVLRRVNAGLPEELRRRQVYGDVGKRWFSSRVLGRDPGDRILVPATMRAWCDQVAAEQVEALEAAGYDVCGDLADLACSDAAFAESGVEPAEEQVADAAVAALRTVVSERSEAVRSPAPHRRRRWRRLLARVGP